MTTDETFLPRKRDEAVQVLKDRIYSCYAQAGQLYGPEGSKHHADLDKLRTMLADVLDLIERS